METPAPHPRSTAPEYEPSTSSQALQESLTLSTALQRVPLRPSSNHSPLHEQGTGDLGHPSTCDPCPRVSQPCPRNSLPWQPWGPVGEPVQTSSLVCGQGGRCPLCVHPEAQGGTETRLRRVRRHWPWLRNLGTSKTHEPGLVNISCNMSKSEYECTKSLMSKTLKAVILTLDKR